MKNWKTIAEKQAEIIKHLLAVLPSSAPLTQHRIYWDKVKQLEKELAALESQEVNDSEMLFHECPICNSRCNCSDQPCSCCESQEVALESQEMKEVSDEMIEKAAGEYERMYQSSLGINGTVWANEDFAAGARAMRGGLIK